MSKWGKRKLGDIGEGYIGLTYAPTNVSDTGTIVLRSGNIQDNKLSFSDVVRVNKKIKEKLKVKDEDILICSRNGSSNLVGKSALISDLDEEMTFGAFMMIYKSAYNLFLIHYFHSLYFKRQLSQSATTTINQITKKMLDEIEVPFPPLEIQKQIAKTLDTAAELLTMRKRQITELDNLIRSTFYDMFGDPLMNEKGWRLVPFTNVLVLQRGFDLPVQNRVSSGKIPVYGSNGVLDYHNYPKVRNGGVITGRSGTIGKVQYTLNDYWPLNTTLFSVDLKGNNIIYLAYLLQYFNLGRFYSGTGVPTLNRNLVHKEKIYMTPCSLQSQFAEIVTKIEEQKALVKKAIDETQLLFDSLMSEYFN